MSEAHLPRILCIEDDDELRFPLVEALESVGFDVRSASDGHGGIDAFLSGGADLVVLDLGLPDMDGVSVCRALKTLAQDAFLPVIFLTAMSDTTTMVRVLGEGGDDFCVKPCSLEELAARIRCLLRVRDRELRLQNETGKFRRFALMDPLTELGNRRAFDGDLEREWARFERTGGGLALLIADIDRFKSFNDRYGHPVGDQVLKGVSHAIQEAVRDADRAFRFGGEEFAILLPDATRDGALIVAERVRESVATARLGALSVTVSVGVAVVPDAEIATREALVEAADRALYEAKAAGRDRVVARRSGVSS